MRRRDGFALAAIISSVLALYLPVLRYAFVYDDHWTITGNRGLAAPLSRVLGALLYGHGARLGLADKTRPTMVLSMWIDHRLFGSSPIGYHAHSLLLYCGVAVAAWLSLRVLLGRPRAALLATLFFIAAPIHAEVVACIDYREDLLVAVNVLAVIALFFAPRRMRTKRPRPLDVLGVLVATACALGAKESGAVLPVLLLAVAWARKDDLPFVRRRDAFVVTIVVITVVFVNWRLTIPDDVPRAPDPGLAARTLATARYEVRAVVDACLPFFWSPERARPAPASPLWLAPLVALAALLVALRRSPRTRPFAIGLAFALVAPIASCPLALPTNELADRYFFLGALGGALVFGAAVDRALAAPRSVVRRMGAAVALLVLGASAVTASRARMAFESDEALWVAAVDRAPDSPRAWTGLSRVRRLEGRLSDADDADARALSIDPTYAPARVTHAYNLLARGEVAEARGELSALDDDDDHLPGLRHARECAALSPAEAAECIAK